VENVISEFRIVETDDGYRIEIKGDKEAIKAVTKGFPFKHGHRGPDHFFFHRHAKWAMGFCGPWTMAEAGQVGPDVESSAAED
jgi:hypothetical protein